MLKVDLSFGSNFAYQNAFVEMHDRSHALSLTLKDGKNTCTSDEFPVGVFHAFEGKRLLAQLKFQYDYDEKQNIVTVCGTDFESSDAMCLKTVPEGTSEYCNQRTSSGGFAADDLMHNPHWNYRTPLMPGLEDVLKKMARAANESLIAALKKVPGLTVKVRTHPPEIAPEDYNKLLTVYRDKKFHGLYEPGTEYGPTDDLFTIESVWGGTVQFNFQEKFANVIGSTNDPKIAGLTWIQLWAKQYGFYPTVCTSYQFNGFPCGNSLVGGHVVTGTVATKVPAGSNSVYIFPICVQHNNDDKVYMEALKYLNGIWLKNYMGT